MKISTILLLLFICCLACTKPKPRLPVTVQSGFNINNSVNLNKKIKAREEQQIQRIIAQDTVNTYLNSGSGFWYFYTKKDSITEKKPVFGNLVNFNYTLKTLNQQYIYSPETFQNQQYRIDKEELFFGLREGLKLLQEGESATFLIPSHLAFGFYGDLKKIGANTPIISEVTVNSISKN